MVRPNQPPVNVSEEVNLSDIRRQSSATASGMNGMGPGTSPGNPESDSFGYIETVLESLAVLGELGNGLDVVAQRLPLEIYALLETTIDEVNDRAEFNKRMMILAPGAVLSAASMASTATGGTVRPASMIGGSRNLTLSGLRLASLESSLKPADQETLRDMFWTLYSKLDAVLQGLRVVYEIANRIGSVSAWFPGSLNYVLNILRRDGTSEIHLGRRLVPYFLWQSCGTQSNLRYVVC